MRVSKLNDAESEAAETQTWIAFSVRCGYLEEGIGEELGRTYDHIIGKLVSMIHNPSSWLIAT